MNDLASVADMNLVKMVGTVSSEPKVFNDDPTKTPFVSFGLEIEEKSVIGNAPTRKSWHQLKGFGAKLADLASQLMPGARVRTFARVATRSYGDEDNPKYITEIIIDSSHFEILKAVTEVADPMGDFDADKSEMSAAQDWADAENRKDADPETETDEIPF